MFKRFARKFLRPFWFSAGDPRIKPPKVYGSGLMLAFFGCVAAFLYMAIEKYSASILGVTATLVATLAGLYWGVISLYNKGKDSKEKNNVEGTECHLE